MRSDFTSDRLTCQHVFAVTLSPGGTRSAASTSFGMMPHPRSNVLYATRDRPTASTGDPNADAFLWIKHPGESDGACNGGPVAGTWWADYALGLAQRAAY